MIAATSWTYQRSCAKAKRNNATSSIVQAPCLSRHCYTHSSNRKHSPHNGKKQNFFSVKSLSVNKRCGRKETICSCPMLSCIPLPNQMLVNWKSSMQSWRRVQHRHHIFLYFVIFSPLYTQAKKQQMIGCVKCKQGPWTPPLVDGDNDRSWASGSAAHLRPPFIPFCP